MQYMMYKILYTVFFLLLLLSHHLSFYSPAPVPDTRPSVGTCGSCRGGQGGRGRRSVLSKVLRHQIASLQTTLLHAQPQAAFGGISGGEIYRFGDVVCVMTIIDSVTHS